MLRVGIRGQKGLEEVAVQVSEVGGPAGGEDDAEVVVAHVGGEVVADDARDAVARPAVDDGGLQHFDDRDGVAEALAVDVDAHRDDVELEGVARSVFVAVLSQVVETAVDHGEGVAEVLLPLLAAGEVGEVRGDAGVGEGAVVLVETGAVEGEGQVRHRQESAEARAGAPPTVWAFMMVTMAVLLDSGSHDGATPRTGGVAGVSRRGREASLCALLPQARAGRRDLRGG